MSFAKFQQNSQGVQLLQRSLERGRLAHGYLFSGSNLDELEGLAASLAKTLNCLQPVKRQKVAVDCCDGCLSCRKIEHLNHADVHWVRPESKSGDIRVDQMRELMREMQLKPTEAQYKVAVVVAAERLGAEAGNAFLKTLEEPPAKSVLILLTTNPQRVLETILSRCLRLNFAVECPRQLTADQTALLTAFGNMAGSEQKSLLGRYRLVDVVSRRLKELKEAIDKSLRARSPIERYSDEVRKQLEKDEGDLLEQWEKELAAAVEAEYRRQRTDEIGLLQWWFRDVWLLARMEERRVKSEGPRADGSGQLLSFPDLEGPNRVAQRITAQDALANLQVMEQLQRWLYTKVKEEVVLEVGLLKLRL